MTRRQPADGLDGDTALLARTSRVRLDQDALRALVQAHGAVGRITLVRQQAITGGLANGGLDRIQLTVDPVGALPSAVDVVEIVVKRTDACEVMHSECWARPASRSCQSSC